MTVEETKNAMGPIYPALGLSARESLDEMKKKLREGLIWRGVRVRDFKRGEAVLNDIHRLVRARATGDMSVEPNFIACVYRLADVCRSQTLVAGRIIRDLEERGYVRRRDLNFIFGRTAGDSSWEAAWNEKEADMVISAERALAVLSSMPSEAQNE